MDDKMKLAKMAMHLKNAVSHLHFAVDTLAQVTPAVNQDGMTNVLGMVESELAEVDKIFQSFDH